MSEKQCEEKPSRPATAGRLSATFAENRQRSLKHLLKLSSASPSTGLSDEALNVIEDVDNERQTARSPFRLLEGRKKMSRDLAERGWGGGGDVQGGSAGRRPATANPVITNPRSACSQDKFKFVAGAHSGDEFEVAAAMSTAAVRDDVGGGVRGRGGRRPMTAAPAGREAQRSVAADAANNSDAESLPRWQREGGITSSIHRLHCMLEDRADAREWRKFDDFAPETREMLLSFVNPAEKAALGGRGGAAGAALQQSTPRPPSTFTNKSRFQGSSGAKQTALPKGSISDIWLARVNLKVAQRRHDRMQVVLAEEVKWIYDQRIKLKGEITNGECKTLLMMGLGKEDYKGLAAEMQGEYKKSPRTECGRPVFVRLGGMAMWFAGDCEGCSQPSDKEADDEGEWWIGPIQNVGLSADLLLGPPALGVLRVRDSAKIPVKIFRTWRVYRP